MSHVIDAERTGHGDRQWRAVCSCGWKADTAALSYTGALCVGNHHYEEETR